MPPFPSRMTKNQGITVRYRPGKAEVQSESEKEEESDEDQDIAPRRPAPPKATTFPPRKQAGTIISKSNQTLKHVPKPTVPKSEDLEGFVTASESSEGEGDGGAAGSGSGSGSEEEDSSDEGESSEDEPQRPMLRPTFISKAKRAQQQQQRQQSQQSISNQAAEDRAAEEERRRKEKADEILKAQLEREAADRAAGRKAWDDDADIEPEDQVDDTDDVDPEAEQAAWKLRELKRVRRDRQALIEKEQEREEIERRRNLTAEEREAEDKAYIQAQEDERSGRGKMAFMQRYHHKGAFFQNDDQEQDEEVKAALNRDVAGATFADEAGDKALLPEYMRIRDMTRLGKKGRTRYKDLKSEDTGQWGDFSRKRQQGDDVDDRFRPDEHGGGGREMTGANRAPVGVQRKRRDEAQSPDRDEKRPRYD